jgi:hypothetical protein
MFVLSFSVAIQNSAYKPAWVWYGRIMAAVAQQMQGSCLSFHVLVLYSVECWLGDWRVTYSLKWEEEKGKGKEIFTASQEGIW